MTAFYYLITLKQIASLYYLFCHFLRLSAAPIYLSALLGSVSVCSFVMKARVRNQRVSFGGCVSASANERVFGFYEHHSHYFDCSGTDFYVCLRTGIQANTKVSTLKSMVSRLSSHSNNSDMLVSIVHQITKFVISVFFSQRARPVFVVVVVTFDFVR